MLNFKEYLAESSMSRLVNHIKDYDLKERTVGIISACRGNLSKSENASRTNRLKSDMAVAFTGKGIGYISVFGSYDEKQDDGSIKTVKEASFLLVAPKEKADYLEKMIRVLGAKYGQDSVLIVRNKVAKLVYTRDVDDDFGSHKKGSFVSLGQFHPVQIGDYYTKMKNSAFTFVSVTEEIEMPVYGNYNNAMMVHGYQKFLEENLDENGEVFDTLRQKIAEQSKTDPMQITDDEEKKLAKELQA